jgi:hypothetical protein
MQAHIQAEKRRAEAELQAERGRAAAELLAEKRRGENEAEAEKRRSEEALEAERRRAEEELGAERRRWEKEFKSEKRRSQDALQAERRRAEEEVDAERRRWEQEFESAKRKAEVGLLEANRRTQDSAQAERKGAELETETRSRRTEETAQAEHKRSESEMETGSRRTKESGQAENRRAEAETEAQKWEAEAGPEKEALMAEREIEAQGRKVKPQTPVGVDDESRGLALAPQQVRPTAADAETLCAGVHNLERAAQSEGVVAQDAPAASVGNMELGKLVEVVGSEADSVLDRHALPRSALRTRTTQSQTERPGHGRASTQTLRTCTASAQAQTLRPVSVSKWVQTPRLDSCHSTSPVLAKAVDHATQVSVEGIQTQEGPDPRVREEPLEKETVAGLTNHREPDLPEQATQTSVLSSLHRPVRPVTPPGSSSCPPDSPTLPSEEGTSSSPDDPQGDRLAKALRGKVTCDQDTQSSSLNCRDDDSVSCDKDVRSPSQSCRDVNSQTHNRCAPDGTDAGIQGNNLQEPDALGFVPRGASRAHSWRKDRAELLEWACGIPELDAREATSSQKDVAQSWALAEERRLRLETAHLELKVWGSCALIHSCMR